MRVANANGHADGNSSIGYADRDSDRNSSIGDSDGNSNSSIGNPDGDGNSLGYSNANFDGQTYAYAAG